MPPQVCHLGKLPFRVKAMNFNVTEDTSAVSCGDNNRKAGQLRINKNFESTQVQQVNDDEKQQNKLEMSRCPFRGILVFDYLNVSLII